jgi:uncharacterized protein (TIGR03435 family)
MPNLNAPRHNAFMILAASRSIPTLLVWSVLVPVLAQTSEPVPKFEVASIKLSPSDSVGFQSMTKGGRYRAMTATVKDLICWSYGVHGFQISGGPPWLSSVAYDVEARLDPGTKPATVRLMVQALLGDRFGLKFHRAARETVGYELRIAEGGAKVKERKEGGRGLGLGRGSLSGDGATINQLASELADQTGVAISNATGLVGRFDFDLKWAEDASDVNEPPLASALREQIGLKLVKAKVSIQVMIIDHAEKAAEN